ncbi:MAG: hypothetical protein A3B94_01955 [Candidatus Jacksonbacteria bacterium RIFCSPHIGHO2_02_FULL_43_10]|nr:MAG: hypothetical protein A3B94_01955 [Candidatus Jacksonbacteria bacterium RIFCSPHIGHO2_02_FULL_43_10]
MVFEKIQNDVTQAMKARDQLTVDTLRMMIAALKNERIALGHDLSSDEVVSVILREVKKRTDAQEAFQKGNRPELAEKEGKEKVILERYLPVQMSDEEVESIVREAIAELGSEEVHNVGQIMKIVMHKVHGTATGQRVSDMVKKVSA